MKRYAAQLADGAAVLGLPLTESDLTRMLDYVELLARWNRRFNLTAIREPADMIAGHLLDSLAVVPALRGTRFADVGSGAGLPGIPVAMARPDCHLTLIDANGKKTRFLREALRVLRLTNAEVVQARVEDYRPEAGFDTVVCRAFARLPRIVDLAGHLCDREGIIVALKGRYPADEVDALSDDWTASASRLKVPGLDKTRHAITLCRQQASGG